ncbi:MAG: FecR family protein [Saprospiraceae bacterium]
MKENKYIELIAQHLSGEISEKDRKDLMEWVDADAKNQALLKETTQLWEISEEYDSPFETNMNEAWKKVEQKIEVTNESKDSSAKVIRLSNFKQFLQIAAVFLIGAVGLFFFFQNKEPELFAFNTNDEQTLDFFLPDSSRVVLNENSHLTYQDLEGKRIVRLEGEAWFDVKHLDAIPFEIESGEAKTVVLGTAFNVRAYPQEDIIEVSVERGKVAFFEKENKENIKILKAGTEGVFDKVEKTEIKKEKRQNENAIAWRTMTLDFENVKLEKVFETLERYFEVKIEADSKIKNCSINGNYKNPKVEDVLNYIKGVLGLEYKINGTEITITGEGCQSVN